MKHDSLNPILLTAVFAIAGCAGLDLVRGPGGTSSSSATDAAGKSQPADASDDPCQLPAARRTDEQHAWCQEQDRLRRRAEREAWEQAAADPNKAQREAILPLAAVSRFPGLTADDSLNVRKVAEVLAEVTPDMLVHATHPAAWVPGSGSEQCQDPVHVGRTEELDPFGLTLQSHLDFTPKAFKRPRATPSLVCNDAKARRALGSSDPAIVWASDETDKDKVVLIALDGSRYVGWVTGLTQGAPPPENWPATAPNPIMSPDEALYFARRGNYTDDRVAPVVAARDRYEACHKKVAPRHRANVQKIEREALTASQRDARLRPAWEAYYDDTHKRCGVLYTAFVAPARAFLAAEKTRRENLYRETVERLRRRSTR